jgi:hypothetical protein
VIRFGIVRRHGVKRVRLALSDPAADNRADGRQRRREQRDVLAGRILLYWPFRFGLCENCWARIAQFCATIASVSSHVTAGIDAAGGFTWHRA